MWRNGPATTFDTAHGTRPYRSVAPARRVAHAAQWRSSHAVHVAVQVAVHPRRPLYEAFKALRDGPTWSGLNPAQQRIVENELRDFVLGGVALEVCVTGSHFGAVCNCGNSPVCYPVSEPSSCAALFHIHKLPLPSSR